MLYYGDRASKNIPFHNEIMEGFDFYNVYHTLSTRLKAWYESNKNYRLMEVELFTLCDIIQQRLDNPVSHSQSDESVELPSIFYHEKHNVPISDRSFTILTFMTKIIEQYLEKTEIDEGNDVYKIYLYEKAKEFNLALCKLENGCLSAEDKFEPAALLKECSKISKTEKIGWKIEDDLTTINKQLYDYYKMNKSYETVLEHIYECYLIGLLYLPSRSGDTSYDKQKVLNMLLIHDIDECHSGDYPPFYDKIEEVKEEEAIFNKGLFIKGVHNNIADLTEYLELWQSWENDFADDINIKIAYEIDKIQMIYKMLRLLKDTDIKLSGERIQRFLMDKRKIKTEEGKKIYEIIITKNADFKDLFDSLHNCGSDTYYGSGH